MKVSDNQLSLEYGFTDSYFKAMEKNNKEKYDMIFSFSEDRRESISLYIEYVKSLIEQMQEIMYTFEKKRHYGLLLVKLGIAKMQKNLSSYYDMEDYILYKFRDDKDYLSVQYKVVRKYEKIIDYKGKSND